MRIHEAPLRSILECTQTHDSIAAYWPGGRVLLIGDERPRLTTAARELTRWAILAERVTDTDLEIMRRAAGHMNIVQVAKSIGRLRAAELEMAEARLVYEYITRHLRVTG